MPTLIGTRWAIPAALGGINSVSAGLRTVCRGTQRVPSGQGHTDERANLLAACSSEARVGRGEQIENSHTFTNPLGFPQEFFIAPSLP
jgi:hypothetical protein